MRIFTRFVFALLTITSIQLSAQDVHFSMFYASPLNLNPALTGVFDGCYRATGIYRNQWRSFTVPFVTYSASFDIKLLQTKLKNDIFAVGGLFVGDKSGDGKLTMNSGMLSVAYHKGLDKSHKHFLGLGIQLGYTQKSLKYQQLTFPAQFDGTGFDLGQSNGENISKPNIGYFDMQAGLLYQGMVARDRLGIMAGLAFYHLVRPNQSFLGDKNVKLGMRYSPTLGLRINAVKNFYITPNFIFQYQNKATEFNLGQGFEYHIPAGKSVLVTSIGAWYRFNIKGASDAAIVTAGLEYYRLRLMAAYDINVSKLKTATGGRGGFEIALIYTGLCKNKSVTAPILVPCPRM